MDAVKHQKRQKSTLKHQIVKVDYMTQTFFCFQTDYLLELQLTIIFYCRLVIGRYLFFITDTDYLYVYVPDNRYAEPIFIFCYKVNK